jgi:hypothetical protein
MSWIKAKHGALLMLFENAEEVASSDVSRCHAALVHAQGE